MPSWIGKLRMKAQEMGESSKRRTKEHEQEKKRRERESHRASGYYRLEWDWPQGRQMRSFENEVGAGGLRLLLRNWGAADIKVDSIIVRRANKARAEAAKYRYEVSWSWPEPSGSQDIGNEVSLLLQKQKLKMAGAVSIRSVFKPPVREKVTPKAVPPQQQPQKQAKGKKRAARLSR